MENKRRIKAAVTVAEEDTQQQRHPLLRRRVDEDGLLVSEMRSDQVMEAAFDAARQDFDAALQAKDELLQGNDAPLQRKDAEIHRLEAAVSNVWVPLPGMKKKQSNKKQSRHSVRTVSRGGHAVCASIQALARVSCAAFARIPCATATALAAVVASIAATIRARAKMQAIVATPMHVQALANFAPARASAHGLGWAGVSNLWVPVSHLQFPPLFGYM